MPRLLIAAALLASCELNEETTVTISRTDPATSALQGVQHRMHVRFQGARQIEQAVAWNMIDKAHAEANVLAELDEPNIVPAWRPYLDDIQASAREIRRASDVTTAARSLASLGQHCASCHVAFEAHVALSPEPPPRANPRIGPTMADHQWAAMQMWEGLIGPSDERWRVGATALTTVPLNVVAQAVTPASPVDVDDVALVRLYATRALTVAPQERAALFGTLLAACAHCHSLLRDN